MNWLPWFLVAHLAGDFLLQNDWMARGKARSSWVCAVHVSSYLAPFGVLTLLAGVPALAVVLIGIQHFAQDRFALHLRWMRFFGQTPPERWPTGPLCVDQAMHVTWIGIVCWFF